MKSFWQYISMLAESFERARAAAELTRQGKYQEARVVFENNDNAHP